MHRLLRHTYWGAVNQFQAPWQPGPLLASAVRDWRDIRLGTSKLATIPTDSFTIQQERILDKVLIALHQVRKYTVQDLLSGAGWGLCEYRRLPKALRSVITSKDYVTFCRFLLLLRSYAHWVNKRQPTIKQALQAGRLLQSSHEARDDQDDVPPDTQFDIPASALADLDGLHWDQLDFVDLSEDERPLVLLDEFLCRRWTDGSLFWGKVVAQTHPRQPPLLYRVIHHDGDSEDLNDSELLEAQVAYAGEDQHPDKMRDITQAIVCAKEWVRRADATQAAKNA